MNALSDKENKCIRIGRTYALLSTLLEYKHEHSDSSIGLHDIEWDSRITRRIVQALTLALMLPIRAFLAFAEWISRIMADRKLLRVCAQLDFDSDKPRLPVEKTLEDLWNMHGPSEEHLHGCSLDDRVDCLCLWLDVLYGEGMTARLSVRSRIRKALYAEGEAIRDAADAGVKICLRDPLAVLISEISAELPAYDKVVEEQSTSANRSDIEELERWALDNMAQLSVDELAKTIRAIVEMENRLVRSTEHRLSRGSASRVYRLIWELGDKDQALAEEICDWALQNALNPYVPFGMCNADRDIARNLQEYRCLRATRFARQTEREHQDQGHAAERCAERARRHVVRQARRTEENTERKRIIERLDCLEVIERLRTVACDDCHPLWFYPERYAVVSPDDLERIDPETRAQLLPKLANAPRGPWRQLRQMLLKTSGGNA